jgi:hypothetical protein
MSRETIVILAHHIETKGAAHAVSIFMPEVIWA